MTPIQDLLHRIQWDPEFGNADFELGYYDRVAGRIVRIRVRDVRFEAGDRFAFEATGHDGSIHAIPLHRVREVRRNGALVWQRPEPRLPHRRMPVR